MFLILTHLFVLCFEEKLLFQIILGKILIQIINHICIFYKSVFSHCWWWRWSNITKGLTGSNAAVAVAVAGVCGCGRLRFLAVLRDLYDWYCG